PRHAAGMAVGNEKSARREAENGRQAEHETAPGGAPPGRPDGSNLLRARPIQGCSVVPSRATRLPGRAFARASATRSMNSSSWLGSWWKATKVLTPAAAARRRPSDQAE